MLPLQPFVDPSTWFLSLLLVIAAVPVLVGVIALLGRVSGDDRADEIAALERRVEELESERE